MSTVAECFKGDDVAFDAVSAMPGTQPGSHHQTVESCWLGRQPRPRSYFYDNYNTRDGEPEVVGGRASKVPTGQGPLVAVVAVGMGNTPPALAGAVIIRG